MTTTQGNLASLSRFIFRAPNWYSSLGFALLVAAAAGLAAFESVQFPFEAAWEGVFYIGIPTVVASLGTAAVDGALGGQFSQNRSALLAMACEVLAVAVLTVAAVTAALVPSLGQSFVFDALVWALAIVFAIRLVIVLAVSRHSVLVATVPAGLQTGTAALLLFVYSGTMRYLALDVPLADAFLSRPGQAPPEITLFGPGDFLNLGVLCLLYGVSVAVYLAVLDYPWRNSMGVSGLEFMRGFVGYVAEGSTDIEEFFEGLGEEAIVPVTVLAFRREDGSEKARFVLPMIHPGPMGDVGGGDLPRRVADQAEGLAFPPHATAGHDFNLVTERELDTLLDAAGRAHEAIEYGPEASRSVRVESGEASMLAQSFGDGLLLVNTFAPGFADDVMYSVGLSARAEASVSGHGEVLLVDAHNSNDGIEGQSDLGHVTPGSRRSFDLIETAGEAARELQGADTAPLRLGTAWEETDWEPREGIGPLGVRAAVVEVDGQRTAYVLVDGNNMEPGLRDRLVDAVFGIDDSSAVDDGSGVDHVEVMTSDNHVVNQTEAENQVGEHLDAAELEAIVVRVVDEALEDLEPVAAGMAGERAEVAVFGNDRTETLASHASAVIPVGSALGIAVIVATMAISVLVFVGP